MLSNEEKTEYLELNGINVDPKHVEIIPCLASDGKLEGSPVVEITPHSESALRTLSSTLEHQDKWEKTVRHKREVVDGAMVWTPLDELPYFQREVDISYLYERFMDKVNTPYVMTDDGRLLYEGEELTPGAYIAETWIEAKLM